MNNKLITYAVGVGIVILLLFGAVWFIFLRAPSPAATSQLTSSDSFGTAPNNVVTSNGDTSATTNATQSETEPLATNSDQKIFEIAQGPIVGATLIQTSNPTTTLARYMDQDDGHVYDLPLDVPGAIPQVVSDVTIPGGVRTIWVEGGNAVLMQYLDTTNIVKTLYMSFPVATSSDGSVSPPATQITFLPDGIADLAASPDGTEVAYLIQTATGANGYIANVNGTGDKELFTLPLSQLLISWPAQDTLLVQTKSASGVPGIAFSIDTGSGSITPLLYANGLTATANPTFSDIIYQSTSVNATVPLTYSYNVKSGNSIALSFSPFPEQCIWSNLSTTTMYCATPLQYVPPNYLDLWHQGVSTAADSISSFDVETNQVTLLASPGSATDGGVQSDIAEMAVSPDAHYLDFVTKGDRSLWGVRLTQ